LEVVRTYSGHLNSPGVTSSSDRGGEGDGVSGLTNRIEAVSVRILRDGLRVELQRVRKYISFGGDINKDRS
jgi:hypothetical protein